MTPKRISSLAMEATIAQRFPSGLGGLQLGHLSLELGDACGGRPGRVQTEFRSAWSWSISLLRGRFRGLDLGGHVLVLDESVTATTDRTLAGACAVRSAMWAQGGKLVAQAIDISGCLVIAHRQKGAWHGQVMELSPKLCNR